MRVLKYLFFFGVFVTLMCTVVMWYVPTVAVSSVCLGNTFNIAAAMTIVYFMRR